MMPVRNSRIFQLSFVGVAMSDDHFPTQNGISLQQQKGFFVGVVVVVVVGSKSARHKGKSIKVICDLN